MDILRALSSPDLEVREKTLNLALDLISSRNVEDLVKFLEKEVRFLFSFYTITLHDRKQDISDCRLQLAALEKT